MTRGVADSAVALEATTVRSDCVKDAGVGNGAASLTSSSSRSSLGSVGKVRLKKELRLFEAVSVVCGLIIGTGIFVSPAGVLQETGSVGFSLVIWIACGVLSTMGAICYAELGTLIPESGGDFAYIRLAFGDFPAFLFMWDAVFVFVPTANAIMALTFANYCLKPLYGSCAVPDDAKRFVAAASITFLTFLNCWNMKVTKKIQDVFLITKITALVVVIIAGLTYMFMGHYESFKDPFVGTTTSPATIAVSFYQGMFSYTGYNYLNYMIEEVKNPYVNLPRAIYISMPLVTILYVLANVAYLAVLSPATMLSSDAIAVTFGDKILGVMSWIMPVFVGASALGALSVHIMTSARICFKAACVGLLPDAMALVSIQRKTPSVALIFLGLLSLCCLMTSNVYRLIEYAAFVESTFIGLSVAALLYFRYSRPDAERPVKVPIAIPVVFLACCLFLVVLPVFVRWQEVAVAVGITAAGIPVYLLVKWTTKPSCFAAINEMFTIAAQKTFVSIPQEDYAGDDDDGDGDGDDKFDMDKSEDASMSASKTTANGSEDRGSSLRKRPTEVSNLSESTPQQQGAA